MKVDIKNLPESEIEILVELDPKEWGEFINEAIRELSREAKVDGFRAGHVPREILEQRIGQGKILEKAGDLAVKKTYVSLIAEKKIEAIGRPQIQILKIAKDNPFEFKAKVAVMPQVELGDWRSTVRATSKEKQTEIKVEEKEIADALAWLQKSRTKFVTVARPAQKGDRVEVNFTAKKDGQVIENGASQNHPLVLGEGHFVPGFEDNLVGLKENEEKKFNLVFPSDFKSKDLAGQPIEFEVKMVLVQAGQMPELNDEFVKSLGNFEDKAALEKNIREGITEEKKVKAKDAWRAKVLDSLVKEIKAKAPAILIEAELEKMLHELADSVGQMGLKLEAYLKNISKTQENLKQEWRAKASQRVLASLALWAIAQQEKIEVSAPEIEADINHMATHYPDWETIRQQIDMEQLKVYTEGRLQNEKVFELFESL